MNITYTRSRELRVLLAVFVVVGGRDLVYVLFGIDLFFFCSFVVINPFACVGVALS